MKRVVYGLQHLKFVDAIIAGDTAGSFPDFAAAVGIFDMTMIVPDSFNQNQDDAENLEVEWEEVDGVALRIETKKGAQSFTVSTNDMSPEVYEKFMGWVLDVNAESANKDWEVAPVNFVLPPQAVELETKPADKFPAIIRQWAKVQVSVKETGVVGKSGLSNLELTCTILANTDKDGKQIPGTRRKKVVVA